MRSSFRVSFSAMAASVFLLTNCATPMPQTNAGQPAAWLLNIQDKSRLVAEVHGLTAADQFERNKIIALLNDQFIPAAERDQRVKELGDLIGRNDRARSARLKEIFRTTDLMQMSQIDVSMARSAFMVIIHAEHDLEFQKSQLPVALELGKKGIIGNQEYAILADKISVQEESPQIYGTQNKCENGNMQIVGRHDRAAIIVARAEIGLEPLDDYMRQNAVLYGCGGQ